MKQAHELNVFHLWDTYYQPSLQVRNQLQVNFSEVPQVVMLKQEFKLITKCLEIGNGDSAIERGSLS